MLQKQKWEYLEVYLNDDYIYVAFDGNSMCDGDNDLIRLFNKLGQDGWEYCQSLTGFDSPTHYLFRRETK